MQTKSEDFWVEVHCLAPAAGVTAWGEGLADSNRREVRAAAAASVRDDSGLPQAVV